VADAHAHRGRHIITQVTEHKAILDPCKRLQKHGYEITWLGVDRFGRIDVDELRRAIRPDTILASIMWANNEIGTLQEIRAIGEICRAHGVLFHTDATQAVSKVPIDVEADCIDPVLDGGGHERGYRSGTLNVTGIVGVGAACEIAQREMADEIPRLRKLRDRLQEGIVRHVDGVLVNGYEPARLPHMTNLAFEGVDHDQLLGALHGIAVSSGSACTSASLEPSYVLTALGLPDRLAFTSLRFALGKRNTVEEVDVVVDRLSRAIGKLRRHEHQRDAEV
jgi:cysteine desulfurase